MDREAPELSPPPSASIIQREIPLLVLLAGAAVVLFLFTRSVAAWDHRIATNAASWWYERGVQALRAQKTDAAIRAFREAVAEDPGATRNALALAGALAATERTDEADRILLSLREEHPELGEVNLQLARLAASQRNLADAARYYHNAIYGVWNADANPSRPQAVRRELVGLLLGANNRSAALSELLALSAEVPHSADANIELAKLFVQAGDPQHALEHFNAALEKDPTNAAALEGAGTTALALGDYARATRYLADAVKAGADAARIQPWLDVARLVRSADPLAPRLGRSERLRRLADNVTHVAARLQACLDRRSSAALRARYDDLVALRDRLAAARGPATDVSIVEGVETVSAAATAAQTECDAGTPLDRALVLIGRAHGAAGE